MARKTFLEFVRVPGHCRPSAACLLTAMPHKLGLNGKQKNLGDFSSERPMHLDCEEEGGGGHGSSTEHCVHFQVAASAEDILAL